MHQVHIDTEYRVFSKLCDVNYSDRLNVSVSQTREIPQLKGRRACVCVCGRSRVFFFLQISSPREALSLNHIAIYAREMLSMRQVDLYIQRCIFSLIVLRRKITVTYLPWGFQVYSRLLYFPFGQTCKNTEICNIRLVGCQGISNIWTEFTESRVLAYKSVT